MIKLKTGFYEGRDVGYSQFFGENPQAYAKFGLLGHNGIDVPIPTGTKLYSAIDGTVTEQLNDAYGYGIYIKIENNECAILYAHLKSTPLKVGNTVKAGDLVGLSNNTGNSTGPHLHFAVHPKPRDRDNGYNGYINPLGTGVEWINSSTDTTGALEAKIEELRTQREEYRKEISILQDNIKKCAEAKEKFALDAKIASATLIEREDQWDMSVKDYNQQLEERSKEIAELTYEITGLIGQIASLTNEIEKLKAEKQAKLCDYTVRELIKALFSCR